MPATGQFSYAHDRTAAVGMLRGFGLQPDSDRRRRLTYLDTFDWRVHRAGFVLARVGEEFELSDAASGAVVVRAPAPEDGALPPALAERIGDVLAPRALLPVAGVETAEAVLSARDAQDKTVVRLQLSEAVVDHDGVRTPLTPRMSVLPLRGYDRPAARLTEQLGGQPGVEPVSTSLFEEAVAATGRRPGDYSSKLSLRLSREQSTYDAARLIYRTLLVTLTVNEAGVLADLDSEFLHDYRVAVRRTRSALKELPGALPADVEERFREEFRWLGQVTTPTRDLDVYLLEFPSFRAVVGDAADDLEHLRRLIVADQRAAHAQLGEDLRSERYHRLVDDWAAAVRDSKPSTGPGPVGAVAIGATADLRIAKVAGRVLRDGGRIDDSTPAEKLHDLRKRCKELRYLLEFFVSLYDPKLHGPVLSALKGLQDNLGQFQDTHVQRLAVEGFADRLAADRDTSAPALMAVGRLVAAFDDRERRARAEFAERFGSFAGQRNRERIERLTAGRS